VQRSSKARATLSRVLNWRQGPYALLLALGLLAASCTKETGNIGVGLPAADSNTGAYLIDTLTVRSSTVLRDSLITSTATNLLVGAYTDPLLGKITAASYFRVSLGSGFRPEPEAVFDSITLVLKPDAYRYGDTTQTQALFEVHRITSVMPTNVVAYSSPKLTPTPTYSSQVLNYAPASGAKAAPIGRARPNLKTLRLRLDPAFGEELLAAGRGGRITSADDFDDLLRGLALTPAATDDAAIVRMSATSTDAGLVLYYHLPTDPTTVLTTQFSLSLGARRFYQVTVDRGPAGIKNLPTTSLASVSAARTGEQSVIEGALGLQTRLEFPYLTDLQQFGPNLTVTSATLTAQVPTITLSPFVPVPPALTVSISDASNHSIGTYLTGVTYNNKGISPTTSLQESNYSWSIASYCQQVLNRTIPNNGMLLSSATPTLPDRAVLGSQRNADNKLQLRLYFITVQ